MARLKTGKVVSAKNDKTIVVKVVRYIPHPKYKKRFRKTTKFHVHDEKNQYKIGDRVTFYETRPLSKMKRWTTEPGKSEKSEKKNVEQKSEATAVK